MLLCDTEGTQQLLCIVGQLADHARAALAAVYIQYSAVYTYALLMDERWSSAVTLNRSSSAAEVLVLVLVLVLVNGAQAELLCGSSKYSYVERKTRRVGRLQLLRTSAYSM